MTNRIVVSQMENRYWIGGERITKRSAVELITKLKMDLVTNNSTCKQWLFTN